MIFRTDQYPPSPDAGFSRWPTAVSCYLLPNQPSSFIMSLGASNNSSPPFTPPSPLELLMKSDKNYYVKLPDDSEDFRHNSARKRWILLLAASASLNIIFAYMLIMPHGERAQSSVPHIYCDVIFTTSHLPVLTQRSSGPTRSLPKAYQVYSRSGG
jgi:hypothetical protein